MNIYTTLREIRDADACVPRYKHLCEALGGVNAYGADTPLSISKIRELNGDDDALWAMGRCQSLSELYDDYWAKRKLLYDDYQAKRKMIDDDYWAKRKMIDDDYQAKVNLIDDDYRAKAKLIDDDYWAKAKLIDEDYEAKRKMIDDDYRAKCSALLDQVIADAENEG